MLHRFVLHSAHSGRTSECCVRGPVSLSPLQAAARDLLAAESDPASASAPLPLLSYSDEHDPHNTVDSEKELKELITIKREEKERREAGLKQEQEAAAAAGAAPEASPSHELSDSILIVEHPQEGKQTEEEITIDLIVRQVSAPPQPMRQSAAQRRRSCRFKWGQQQIRIERGRHDANIRIKFDGYDQQANGGPTRTQTGLRRAFALCRRAVPSVLTSSAARFALLLCVVD